MARKPRALPTGVGTTDIVEHELQKQIMETLCQVGWIVVRVNSGAWPTSNGGWLRTYWIEGFGGYGFPDLLLMRHGRTVLLEVKRRVGKVRESQEKFQALCEERGMEYRVARSMDDVEDLIRGGAHA